jgi:hypothetical protein
MFRSSDILSLFEPAVGKADSGRRLYEILLKPAHPSLGGPAQSPLILRLLEEGQVEGRYQLEGLIHWPAGLLIRLRISDSLGLGPLLPQLKARTAPPGCGPDYWEDEPASIRFIQPGAENRPGNLFAHQRDRICQFLDLAPFPTVGFFYFHRTHQEDVVPAA